MPQFSSDLLCKWLKKEQQEAYQVSQVCVDSRQIQPHNMFFALPGAQSDGHNFLQEVASKGAKVAVVKKEYTGPDFGLSLIRVEDTLIALQNLAKERLLELGSHVIAVTGSVGKTTTKDFIYSLLKSTYKVSKSIGNQNSQIGLAVSLLNESVGDEDFFVLEMGMTKAGHIQKLIEVAPPSIALITSIALVHAENFAGIESIAQAKSEIFSLPNTVGIVNAESECLDVLLQTGTGKKHTYSTKANPQAFWSMKVEQDFLRVVEDGKEIKLPYVDLIAPHVYTNCLGAIAAARMCKVGWDAIALSLKELRLPEKRLQEQVKQGITFINDAYNASEMSVKAALSMIAQKPCAGKKIAILGSMLELGDFSEGCHARVGMHALECVNEVICFGKECKPMVEVCKKAGLPVEWFLDFDELQDFVKKNIRKDDLVLIKGSRSLGLWRVLDLF